MIGYPLQAGVGENNVEAALGVEAAEIARVEAQAVPRKGTGLGQHRFRGIDPDRGTRLGVRVQTGSQLSGAAPQVDHVAARNRLHHREEVEERLRTFGGELRVLIGIPTFGDHRLVRHRHTSRHRNQLASGPTEKVDRPRYHERQGQRKRAEVFHGHQVRNRKRICDI